MPYYLTEKFASVIQQKHGLERILEGTGINIITLKKYLAGYGMNRGNAEKLFNRLIMVEAFIFGDPKKLWDECFIYEARQIKQRLITICPNGCGHYWKKGKWILVKHDSGHNITRNHLLNDWEFCPKCGCRLKKELITRESMEV